MRLTLTLGLVLSLPYSLPWLAETVGPVVASLVIPTVEVPEHP